MGQLWGAFGGLVCEGAQASTCSLCRPCRGERATLSGDEVLTTLKTKTRKERKNEGK